MIDDDKYSKEWFDKKLSNRRLASAPRNSMKYWLFTIIDGKVINCGCFLSEDDANQRAYQSNLTTFEVLPLRTTDISTAQRMAKGKIFSETKDIRLAMNKMGRKVK